MHPAATVYVVDDDSSVRRALARLIRTAGYAVEAFASAEAFDGGSIHGPACLLLDLDLEGMDGIEYDRTLAERMPWLPVIFMSANDDDRRCRAARARGAVFLAKPFEGALLLSAIEGALVRCRKATGDHPECGAVSG